MHPHNHSYGAAAVLAVAAQQDRVWTVPSIPGHVQHGSDLFNPCPEELEIPSALTAFVWSRSGVRRRARHALRNQVATGSPWLHLLTLDPDLLEEERPIDPITGLPEKIERPVVQRSGTLLFVEHGLDGALLVPRVVQAARERYGETLTVALRHRDATTAPIVQAYSALGVAHADLGPLTDRSGTAEPGHLVRLRALMQQFTTVAANSAREELLYAVSLDQTIGLVGPGPNGHLPRYTETEITDMADDELGRADMLLPAELLDLFEWRSHRD